MNVLTNDLISLIASRNNSTITLKYITSRSTIIAYLDQNGKYHRINSPAIILSDNGWVWCFNGKRHRDRYPALYAYGYYRWYNMDKVVAERES